MLKKKHFGGRQQSRGSQKKAVDGNKINNLLKRAETLKNESKHRDSINLKIRATTLMIKKINAGIAIQKTRGLSTKISEKDLAEKQRILDKLKSSIGKLK
jgi:hypothetical protein